MTISTGSLIRATAKWSHLYGGQIVNVFHLLCSDDNALTQVQLRSEIAAYLEAVYTPIVSRISAQTATDDIELFNISADAPEPGSLWPSLTGGTNVGEDLPMGVAAFSLARTGISRTFGKKYWPLFTEGSAAYGYWDPGTMAALAAANAVWIAPYTGPLLSGWLPAIYSRVTYLTHHFIEATSTNVPAYQRRRKPGVGA